MIVQAIGLLDELDKEINTYAMRVKEWFGWHFPEMAKVTYSSRSFAQKQQVHKTLRTVRTFSRTVLLEICVRQYFCSTVLVADVKTASTFWGQTTWP